MTAEAGHFPNRVYIDRNGNLHINSAGVYDDNEVDISPHLAVIGAIAAADMGYFDDMIQAHKATL